MHYNVFEGARVAVDGGSRPGVFPDAFITTWSSLGSTPAPLIENER